MLLAASFRPNVILYRMHGGKPPHIQDHHNMEFNGLWPLFNSPEGAPSTHRTRFGAPTWCCHLPVGNRIPAYCGRSHPLCTIPDDRLCFHNKCWRMQCDGPSWRLVELGVECVSGPSSVGLSSPGNEHRYGTPEQEASPVTATRATSTSEWTRQHVPMFWFYVLRSNRRGVPNVDRGPRYRTEQTELICASAHAKLVFLI